jgi:DNA-binding NtrC family response regulator
LVGFSAEEIAIQTGMAEISILTVGCDWALRQAPAGALARAHSVTFAESVQECREKLRKQHFDVLVIGPDGGEAAQNAASRAAEEHGTRRLLLYHGEAAPAVAAEAQVSLEARLGALISALEQIAPQK